MIWRSGSSISLYRGISYDVPQPVKKPYHSIPTNEAASVSNATSSSPAAYTEISRRAVQDPYEGLPAPAEEKKNTEATSEVKYESEMDSLLDSLGPRYSDWPGPCPLPVDADMLPGVVPGYKPPFRILPYGVRPSLGYKERTALMRLSRVLPPHFALGKEISSIRLPLIIELF